MKMLTFVALAMLAGTVSAQSNRQFYDELFCHDLARAEQQALIDYRNNVPIATAEQRADGYLCADTNPQVCDVRRDEIRKQTRLIYTGLGPNADVRSMGAAKFMKFADMLNTGSMSQCMGMVKRQQHPSRNR